MTWQSTTKGLADDLTGQEGCKIFESFTGEYLRLISLPTLSKVLVTELPWESSNAWHVFDERV